ncbi:MAG: class I SAM-dependent methyltransferase [Alphaproteobacteria bacterium]|nr:class I SAM-dependent methyltransferase [Alphaproteobacteria bacterium]
MINAQQTWSPETYLRHGAFVSLLGEPVVQVLAPQAGERILDLGCGEGILTEKIAAAGAEVIGLDNSEAQVEGARQRGLDARVGDALEMTFENEFDAVFSNAALHWMSPLSRVFENVHRALKPGGRFVAEMGGAGNIHSIRMALYNALMARGLDPVLYDPWSYLGDSSAAKMLERAGFEVRSCSLLHRPTELPGDLGGWLETFAGSFMGALPQKFHRQVIEEVTDALRPTMFDPHNKWIADYVRLRFKVVKPE